MLRSTATICLFALALCGCGPSTTPSPTTSGVTASASATPARPTAAATSNAPSAAAATPIRIPISGAAPATILLDGPGAAWVLSGEGGTLAEVDLVNRRESDSFDVGFGATHLARPTSGVFAVGRYDNRGSGAYCILVDAMGRQVSPVQTGELAALTAGDEATVWAVEKSGRLVKVDIAKATVVNSAPVQVGQNVHIEVQWAAGSAWIGSDGLPVVRISGENLELEKTIAVPTGIPFLFQDGLMWGAGPTELWAIDTATNELSRHVPLANVMEILGLDIDPDGAEAWIAVRHPGYLGAVLRVDLTTGAVVDEFAVSLPAAVKLDADHAWVASYMTNELLGFPR